MRNRLKWHGNIIGSEIYKKKFQIFLKLKGMTRNFDKRLKNSLKKQGFADPPHSENRAKKTVWRQEKDFTVVNIVVSTNLANKK